MNIDKIKSRFSPDADIEQTGPNVIRIGRIFVDDRDGNINYLGHRNMSAASARRLSKLLLIAAEIAEMEEDDG